MVSEARTVRDRAPRPLHPYRCLWLALIPLALPGCSDPVTVADGSVEVLADGGAFTVRNRASQDSLVTVIVEQETAALVDLAPCDEWQDPIPPRGQRRVPYEEVIGYEPGAEAAFVYWCLRTGATVNDGGTLPVPFD